MCERNIDVHHAGVSRDSKARASYRGMVSVCEIPQGTLLGGRYRFWRELINPVSCVSKNGPICLLSLLFLLMWLACKSYRL